MLRSYEYRLYPFPLQESGLVSMLSNFCALYNAGLEERMSAYGKGLSIGYIDQANQLKEARAEIPELAGFSYSAEQ